MQKLTQRKKQLPLFERHRLVIELCPNIQFVNIMDYDRKGKLSYPRNLYGLVPTNRMKELILYPYKQEVKRGQNATDVLIEMRTGWEQIAQNESIEALALHQALPISVLERCSWINVQILVLKNNNNNNENKEWYDLLENEGETNVEEWVLCLMKACPNVKYLTHKNDAQLKPILDKILSDNENIWPEMQYRPQTKKKDVASWSEKWFQARHSSSDWVLSYDEVMENFLRGR